MNKSLSATLGLALLASTTLAPAAYAGTVTGAAVGAVAGHAMGGHTKTGAAVGAVAGHHHAAKKASGS